MLAEQPRQRELDTATSLASFHSSGGESGIRGALYQAKDSPWQTASRKAFQTFTVNSR